MGDLMLMITVESLREIKIKLIGDGKEISLFDQLVLVGAVANNEEEELAFENSSSALEALRKLNSLNIYSPRRDIGNGHMHIDDPRLEFTKLKMGDFGFQNGENTSKKNMKYSLPHSSAQHQSLPERFKRKIEAMGGCPNEARLVIEKKLFNSDLERGAGRLTMPRGQCLCRFLDYAEEEWLELRGSEAPITLIDPMVEEEEMMLTMWTYNCSKSYVLRTNWNYVAAKNGLKPNDAIQVWSFRNKNDNRLHLALVKKGDNDSASSSYCSSNCSTIVDYSW